MSEQIKESPPRGAFRCRDCGEFFIHRDMSHSMILPPGECYHGFDQPWTPGWVEWWDGYKAPDRA